MPHIGHGRWGRMVLTIIAVVLGSPSDGASQVSQVEARALVSHAVEMMGGGSLRAVSQVRLDMMTQWQRSSFRRRPWTDRPSFEPHVDIRDYSIPAWRNTREFGSRRLTNIVRDSVATTAFDGAPATPQSVAYVDERNELFMYTPDRLVLALEDAPDLHLAADTLLGGERHRVVTATLPHDVTVRVGFHAGTGLPSVLWFRSDHPNDFGLVPWGEMDVTVWYSGWRSFDDISIPTQWDLLRVNVPYKRMTVRNATFGPDFAPDSFAVSPALREAYLEARRPMHDRSVDSVTVVAPGLLQIHGFGFPTGAVRVGGEWILLEAGHAPLSLERGVTAVRASGAGDLAGAVVVAARAGNGGIANLIDQGTPVYTSAAGRAHLAASLSGRGLAATGIDVVDEPRTVFLNGESLHLIPADLADTPGALITYVPRLKWAYAPDATTPLDRRLVAARLKSLGFEVERIGMSRDFRGEPFDNPR